MKVFPVLFYADHDRRDLAISGYFVRGTVRAVTNTKKVAPIKALDSTGKRLELVEADLQQPACWLSAIRGMDYVLHVASPFPAPGTKDDSIIKTAIEGTLNVLKAAAATESSVKRVVLTSSMLAVVGM